MAKQSRLEAESIKERNIEIVRNDFNSNNEYSSNSDKAKTHDDETHPLGKGTGHGGHLHRLPNPSLPKTTLSQDIDTTDGGGSYDKFGRNGVGGRRFLEAISLYNKDNQYSKALVDIDTTIEGQYFVK